MQSGRPDQPPLAGATVAQAKADQHAEGRERDRHCRVEQRHHRRQQVDASWAKANADEQEDGHRRRLARPAEEVAPALGPRADLWLILLGFVLDGNVAQAEQVKRIAADAGSSFEGRDEMGVVSRDGNHHALSLVAWP